MAVLSRAFVAFEAFFVALVIVDFVVVIMTVVFAVVVFVISIERMKLNVEPKNKPQNRVFSSEIFDFQIAN